MKLCDLGEYETITIVSNQGNFRIGYLIDGGVWVREDARGNCTKAKDVASYHRDNGKMWQERLRDIQLPQGASAGQWLGSLQVLIGGQEANVSREMDAKLLGMSMEEVPGPQSTSVPRYLPGEEPQPQSSWKLHPGDPASLRVIMAILALLAGVFVMIEILNH